MFANIFGVRGIMQCIIHAMTGSMYARKYTWI